jgi:hypothetical protein
MPQIRNNTHLFIAAPPWPGILCLQKAYAIACCPYRTGHMKALGEKAEILKIIRARPAGGKPELSLQ